MIPIFPLVAIPIYVIGFACALPLSIWVLRRQFSTQRFDFTDGVIVAFQALVWPVSVPLIALAGLAMMVAKLMRSKDHP